MSEEEKAKHFAEVLDKIRSLSPVAAEKGFCMIGVQDLSGNADQNSLRELARDAVYHGYFVEGYGEENEVIFQHTGKPSDVYPVTRESLIRAIADEGCSIERARCLVNAHIPEGDTERKAWTPLSDSDWPDDVVHYLAICW